MTTPVPDSGSRRRVGPAGRAWLLIALAMAGLIAIVSRRAEVAGTLGAIWYVAPVWWVAALGLQTLTYLCAAGVWQLALRSNGTPQPFGRLVMLAFAMLFSNQVIPTVGMSGGLVIMDALARDGVPEPVAAASLLLGLGTTYVAFLLGWAAALPLMWPVHYARVLAITAGVAFALMAASVTLFMLQARRVPVSWRPRLQRVPIVGVALASFATAPPRLVRRSPVWVGALALQIAEIVVDGCTLHVSLLSVGWHLAAYRVVACYLMASIASRVAFVPLGLGTFEAACVTFLHAAGVPIGPALAATVIFRGFTLWLPMLPGFWCVRRVVGASGHRETPGRA